MVVPCLQMWVLQLLLRQWSKQGKCLAANRGGGEQNDSSLATRYCFTAYVHKYTVRRSCTKAMSLHTQEVQGAPYSLDIVKSRALLMGGCPLVAQTLGCYLLWVGARLSYTIWRQTVRRGGTMRKVSQIEEVLGPRPPSLSFNCIHATSQNLTYETVEFADTAKLQKEAPNLPTPWDTLYAHTRTRATHTYTHVGVWRLFNTLSETAQEYSKSWHFPKALSGQTKAGIVVCSSSSFSRCLIRGREESQTFQALGS